MRNLDVDSRDTEPEPEQTGPQERVCETCRWFEPEKWMPALGGGEEFRHSRCHRGPGSFATDANDWCSEWKESEEEADRRLAESIREEARRKAEFEDMWAKEGQ